MIGLAASGITKRIAASTGSAAARLCAVAVAVSAVLMVQGCGRDSASSPAGSPQALGAIQQTATLGDAANPSVRVLVNADRSTMTVADRLTLVVTIDAAAGTKVDWVTPPPPLPEAPSSRLGDFSVAAHSQRTIPGRGSVTEHVFVLEPFLDGPKTIPAMTFRASTEGEDTARGGEVSTQPLTIEVTSLLAGEEAEKAELAPALPPVAAQLPPPPSDTRRLALVIGAATVVLACVILIVARLARRRGEAEHPVAVARRALAELRAGLESAAADPFGPAATRVSGAASELGMIIRSVLDRGLSIAAVGATASELAPRLAASNLPSTTREPVERVLRALEQEAFSPAQPRASVLLEHLAVAEELVRTAALPRSEREDESGAGAGGGRA